MALEAKRAEWLTLCEETADLRCQLERVTKDRDRLLVSHGCGRTADYDRLAAELGDARIERDRAIAAKDEALRLSNLHLEQATVFKNKSDQLNLREHGVSGSSRPCDAHRLEVIGRLRNERDQLHAQSKRHFETAEDLRAQLTHAQSELSSLRKTVQPGTLHYVPPASPHPSIKVSRAAGGHVKLEVDMGLGRPSESLSMHAYRARALARALGSASDDGTLSFASKVELEP